MKNFLKTISLTKIFLLMLAFYAIYYIGLFNSFLGRPGFVLDALFGMQGFVFLIFWILGVIVQSKNKKGKK